MQHKAVTRSEDKNPEIVPSKSNHKPGFIKDQMMDTCKNDDHSIFLIAYDIPRNVMQVLIKSFIKFVLLNDVDDEVDEVDKVEEVDEADCMGFDDNNLLVKIFGKSLSKIGCKDAINNPCNVSAKIPSNARPNSLVSIFSI